MFKAVIEDNGFLNLWQAQLKRASKVLRSDPVAQRDFYGGRLAKQIGAWAGAITARNMALEQDSRGKRWPALSQQTVKLKNRDSRGRVGNRKRSINPEKPLIDSGELFRAFTLGSTLANKSVKWVNRSESPVFQVSPTNRNLTISPSTKKRSDGVKWETLFKVHNRPVGEKTTLTLTPRMLFKKRTDGGGRSTPVSQRKYGPVTVPGREFFYFTRADLKALGLMLSYAAMVGGPVNEQGTPVGKGIRGAGKGTKALLNRKAPRIQDMIDRQTRRALKESGALDMINSIR